MTSLNQGFLFIALFVAISVNLSWSPKVMALRDLPIDVAKMKEKFFIPLDNEMTCFRSCTSDPDCSDGWVCLWCSLHSTKFDHDEHWICSMW
ncbi:hypothetical protein P3L10_014144 [Capsicum annuum]